MSTRKPARRRDLAQRAHGSRAVRHGALEMRNAADDLDALVERALEIRDRGGRAVVAVLREGDEFEVDVGRDLALHLEQRVDREQPVVADVDMAADREQALGHREVAIAQRALDHRLVREQRLQLAPQRDAFEQRARLVEARQAERERRVHVEMDVDERRRHEIAGGINDARSLGRDAALDRRDAPVGDRDIEAGAAVGQGRVADDQVEIHVISAFVGTAGQPTGVTLTASSIFCRPEAKTTPSIGATSA